MEKIGHVMTIRAKEVRDRDFIFSYDLASTLDSEYILKTIMKHFIELKDREKEDLNLLVSEHFDTNFEEWLKFNEFMKEGNLTKPFLQILRSVRRLHIYVVMSFKHLKLLILIYIKNCVGMYSEASVALLRSRKTMLN